MLQNSIPSLIIFFMINFIVSGERRRIAIQSHTALNDFNGYHDVSIVHFHVPNHVVFASFKFSAKELKIDGLGSCSPRDVTIYLKHGSIPLGNPDGAQVKATLFQKRKEFYNLSLTSDNDEFELKIVSPITGAWYAIAFRSWTDPESEKITQQGLGAMCSTILDSEITVEKYDVALVIDLSKDHSVILNGTIKSAVLQFFVPENQKFIDMMLTSTCGNFCMVSANIAAEEILNQGMVNSTVTSFLFTSYPGYFHNLNLRFLSGNSTNMTISFRSFPEERITKNQEIQLIRKTLPELFTFDYENLRENSTKPIPVNVSDSGVTVLTFRIDPIHDMGGTLSIGIKLLNESDNTLVVGCISLGIYPNISTGASCRVFSKLTVPDLWVNSTSSQIIYIPYPEPGLWHLSIKAFKLSSTCWCTLVCSAAPCEFCDCMKETSIFIETSIGSSPCINGKCNSHGACHNYLDTGGFTFSACYCQGGYRGFDCADDTYVLNQEKILMRFFMLTLSNLAFIASIHVAVTREYYTEAMVYGAVMFFSTGYHACEAGQDVISICITRLSVLQFCDFYNALLSIWVTLIAMASFGPKLTSFLQVCGAIVLALGAELDKTALWVFLLPVITGSILIGFSWGCRCRRQRNLAYPAARYKNIYFPSGLGIVLLGLVCYAFLQTKKNYHIVHSFWHICVAVGVVLLLPKRTYMK